MLVYFAKHQDPHTSSLINALAVRLLNCDPQQRPSLHMILDEPIFDLKKQKEEVDFEDV